MIKDTELIKRIKNGDQSAFEQIYDRYVSDLYYFILSYIKSAVITEDIIQDTFIRLWVKRDLIDETKEIKSYIFTIAWHLFLKEFKKTSRNIMIPDFMELSQELMSADYSSYDFDLYCKTIQEVKSGLPPRQKEIYTLIKENGKSIKEVAESLGIQEQVVRNQLSSIMKKIRYSIRELK